MIYMPNLNDYECFVVLNDTTIRAYEEMPIENTTIPFRDYFINANYIYKDGFEDFTTNVPVCLSSDVLTDNFYYRNDLDSILIIFLILSIFAFYLPIKLFKRLFRRVK